MGNKCGAFLQSYPDAPVLHVEKLSVWTGSAVSEAQGKLWDKRLAGRDEWGWRGEEISGRREAREWKSDLMFKGEGKEAIECMNKLVRRDKLWGEFWVKVSAREIRLSEWLHRKKEATDNNIWALNSPNLLYSVWLIALLWARGFSLSLKKKLYCSDGSLLCILFLCFSPAWQHNVDCSVSPTL